MDIAIVGKNIINPLFIVLQSQVAPEGYIIFWMIGAIILIMGLLWLILRYLQRAGGQSKTLFQFRRSKLEITLMKDRSVRPKKLTLTIHNIGDKVVDIEAPMLIFRKLWTKRKFKLKKVKGRLVYPLYLETRKKHIVEIDLTRFFEHDKKLKRFYWGRIILTDVKGKTFRSKCVSLRKSLYT